MMCYVTCIIIYVNISRKHDSISWYVASYSAHCAEESELDKEGRMLDEETQKFFVS